MEGGLSINNYLDVSDVSEASEDENITKSEKKSNKKKHRRRDRSRSRSRSRHKKKRHSSSDRDRGRKSYKRRRSYSSDSFSSESESGSSSFSKKSSIKSKDEEKNEYKSNIPRASKWSTKSNYTDQKKIITLNKKEKPKNLKDLQPNENISVEEKEKPNFEPSGLLAKQTNTVNGVVLKFTEPLDAAQPDQEWRLYTFKENNKNDNQDILSISKKSCYLIGKDERIVQILVNHPSCSRQHAVIQFRKITKRNELGNFSTSIKPYILDLESTNGTLLNKEKIEPAKYYELKQFDVINFGFSNRDYVVMKLDKEE